MKIKTIKVKGKDKISIQIRIRKSLNTQQGDELIIAKKEEDFHDLLKHSEKVAKKLWGNKEDEIWNKV